MSSFRVTGYLYSSSLLLAKRQFQEMLTRGELVHLSVFPYIQDVDLSELGGVVQEKECVRLSELCEVGDCLLVCCGLDHFEVGSVCVRRGVEACLRSRSLIEKHFRNLVVPFGVERPEAILMRMDSGLLLHAGSKEALSFKAREYVGRSLDRSDAAFLVATEDLSTLDLYCWDIKCYHKTSKQAEDGRLVLPVYKFFYCVVSSD